MRRYARYAILLINGFLALLVMQAAGIASPPETYFLAALAIMLALATIVAWRRMK